MRVCHTPCLTQVDCRDFVRLHQLEARAAYAGEICRMQVGWITAKFDEFFYYGWYSRLASSLQCMFSFFKQSFSSQRRVFSFRRRRSMPPRPIFAHWSGRADLLSLCVLLQKPSDFLFSCFLLKSRRVFIRLTRPVSAIARQFGRWLYSPDTNERF